MKFYGHITKVQGGYELLICASVRPVGGSVTLVRSRKEARAVCVEMNAAPWNF